MERELFQKISEKYMVDPAGFEPATSAMSMRRHNP